MENLITIGEITKNHGNRGEVRVLPLTSYPERFELLDSVYLVKDNYKSKKELEDVWFHKHFVILKFNGIDNIGQALEMKGFMVKITEDQLIPLENDQFYIYQLLGFTVHLAEGKVLGKIDDILTTGGTDILVINGNNQEFMIPFSHDFIVEIREDNKEIIVDPIPGLLDL